MAEKFTIDILNKLNSLFDLKENAYNVVDIFRNLDSTTESNEKIYLTCSKYKGNMFEKAINLESVSSELRERLINCCKSYAKEIEDKISSIEIIGIE